MTYSTAHANQGLFELTRRPSMTQAIYLTLAENTEETGRSQVKKLKFDQTKSWPFRLTTTWFLGSFGK